ncbi:actin-related protein 6-like [Penaeus monodon]|uniref:actin-related protein 6-like n=1 Tax=Penaeus monodon TaxID=6687 RepID=UPI0018A78F97|nr:actin-related protein 6-like [Penaeus monodon]
MANVFILDNGAYTIKAGFSNQNEPRVMPNAIMKAKSERRRPFIGDQVEECRDASGLFYILPHQKGYLVNWDIQKTVWDYLFGKDVFNVNHSNTTMIVTEPYFNFTSTQEALSEIFFEEYDIDALLRINAGDLSVHKYHRDRPRELCCLLVESGFSFTHIVPYIQGKKQKDAILRIDVGGKVLTNHLKEVISYRQLNVMDETYVINQVKEDACYVAYDFNESMKIARKSKELNTILRDYVLPDFTTIKRGYVRTREESTGKATAGEQLIRLNNERFTIPELLFTPSDVGIQEMGISEAIVHSINKCPEETRPHLFRNILLTGGNCNFEGFKDRVLKDVRSMSPTEFEVNVTLAKGPTTYSWRGGAAISRSAHFPEMLVTKREWEEDGFTVCQERFSV